MAQKNQQQPSVEHPAPTRVFMPTLTDTLRIVVTGAVVGVAIATFTLIIDRFLLTDAFCRSIEALNVCQDTELTAFNTSVVITTLLAVIVLARWNIFRPLLVAVGPAVALWGLQTYIGGLSLLEFNLWLAGLFGLSYALFYWLMRARSFVTSLVLAIVAIIAIRLLLVA